MRNRTLYLTVLQFDLCGIQGDKLDHYRKGAVPEQQMFPISYVKGCKNIHQYTPGTGELVLVINKNHKLPWWQRQLLSFMKYGAKYSHQFKNYSVILSNL